MPRLNLTNWAWALWKSGGLEHSARTGVGAVASLFIAQVLGMPEAYWAPITTIIVTQSTLGAAWDASKWRFIGTIIGAALGGLLASHFHTGIALFGTVIFALGLLCAILRLDQAVYRFASITLAIVTLVTRDNSPWLIAFHRFVEVSLGIAVALVLAAFWPERE